MPFVKEEVRKKLDIVYESMIDADIKANGDLNYILYKFCKYRISPSYNSYKNFLGELNECACQCREDFLIPYEKIKKEENGDV